MLNKYYIYRETIGRYGDCRHAWCEVEAISLDTAVEKFLMESVLNTDVTSDDDLTQLHLILGTRVQVPQANTRLVELDEEVLVVAATRELAALEYCNYHVRVSE